MVTYKIQMDTRRPKSDGTYAISIRITHNRQSTTFNTGVFINQEFWLTDKSAVSTSHQNSALLNKTITETYLKVQKAVIELESEQAFSFDNLKDRLNSQQAKPTISKSLPFKTFAEQLVTDMLSVNETGNAIVYRTTINRFMSFANDDKLKFNAIDYKLLDGFRRHLLKGGVKQNTISNYFRTLRAIYNKAIKAKVVDRSRYPFLDISVKSERTAKRAIAIDDLKAIASINLKPKSRKWHAQNYFFLSFALIGASFTDLAYLTPANIKKGRLTYKRRKTGKELSIKIQPYTEAILNQYTGSNGKYLLPVLTPDVVEDSMKAKALIAQWIKTTNKWLSKLVEDCNLDCEVTTYVARHSWATTAKRSGYSIEVIAEAMGHEHGNRITNIYLDTFDQSLIDQVNEKVIATIL
ncbi:MAG TPA: site-specific integrase [Mucilaginibacter sp.]|jgi:integrase/recombinase XerD|nr:site-specific integrase [Mucilaginibacter sp.]